MATAAGAQPHSEIELKRQIGLYAATAITVGNIIGSGIFRSPHSVAQELSSFSLVLLAWVLGGLLSICGSLVLTELVVTHPKTGGLYVFIREAFGDAFGFVFGWANLYVIKPTVIASITSVFALYFCQAMHLPKSTELGVGCAAILFLTFVNQWVSWGAGPRASQYLVLGAKTRAVLLGRYAPGIEDVRAVAPAVLRHRIVTNFTAEAEGVRPERIIEDLLKSVPTE